MSDEFLKLPKEQRRVILEGAETQLGIKPNLLEKDIWICWVLNKLFTLPKQMAFKGGTSLSKCYGLIDRFSEDVDVTVDYREFMPDLDFAKESKSALKKKRKELQVMVADYVADYVIPMLEREYTREFDIDEFDIEFEGGEKLFLKYPSAFDSNTSGYIADSVLIEFGGTNKTEPNEQHIVTPYLVAEGLVLPTANAVVYSPARTFWEKATLIHVECHRGRLQETPDRLSRHWYDLAMLSNSDIKQKALADEELFNDVMQVKKAFFNASYANYEKCENNEFVLVPADKEIDQLEADYSKMIDSAMFLHQPVPFNEIISNLSELQDEINQR
jgi:hypothetical protein